MKSVHVRPRVQAASLRRCSTTDTAGSLKVRLAQTGIRSQTCVILPFRTSYGNVGLPGAEPGLSDKHFPGEESWAKRRAKKNEKLMGI